MKKLNRAGFTLIELLAVITIMGILMLVAIPSVSRTIENSRRDTFMDNALIYVDTVRTAVLSGEMECGDVDANAVENGKYYFVIATSEEFGGAADVQSTTDLMETVAKSSWGSVDLGGYVVWEKTLSGERTVTTYSLCLADNQKHGMNAVVEEKSLSRSNILTKDAVCPAASDLGATVCTLK